MRGSDGATLVETASLLACFTPSGPGGEVASGQPREEARSRLPLTYSSIDSIDVGQRGWITLDQFTAFTTERTDTLADDILHRGDRM